MTRILVLYGTTEGQTAKVARFLGDTLQAAGVSADVVEAGTARPSPDGYDGVLVAASIHAGGYQRAVHHWVHDHARTLNDKPAAFLSVCLGVLQRTPKAQEDLAAIVDRFLTATGWHPATVKQVAGALPYSKYNWLTRWTMVRIVRKAGGDIDTSRDYEYTDWADLRAFAEEFARSLRARTISEARVA